MALKIENVSKKYAGGKTAVDHLDETFENGIIGLLGPNGAGKSTLMNMIATLYKPTGGTIWFDEKNIHLKPGIIREKLGYLPQDFGVFPNHSAEEFLTYLGLLKGLKSSYLKKVIPEYLEAFNLLEVKKKKIGTFSGGMRQRIGIIQALLGDPKIILLDEPTVGLDPEERINFRSLLSDLSKDKVILLSSHIVSDIETIADKILIMKNGQSLFYGESKEARKIIDGHVFEKDVDNEELSMIKNTFLVTDVKRTADLFATRFVNTSFERSDGERSVAPTLEDVYMYLNEKAS